jgi:hypothetical protein
VGHLGRGDRNSSDGRLPDSAEWLRVNSRLANPTKSERFGTLWRLYLYETLLQGLAYHHHLPSQGRCCGRCRDDRASARQRGAAPDEAYSTEAGTSAHWHVPDWRRRTSYSLKVAADHAVDQHRQDQQRHYDVGHIALETKGQQGE